jgi:hypothetical protein
MTLYQSLQEFAAFVICYVTKTLLPGFGDPHKTAVRSDHLRIVASGSRYAPLTLIESTPSHGSDIVMLQYRNIKKSNSQNNKKQSVSRKITKGEHIYHSQKNYLKNLFPAGHQ